MLRLNNQIDTNKVDKSSLMIAEKSNTSPLPPKVNVVSRIDIQQYNNNSWRESKTMKSNMETNKQKKLKGTPALEGKLIGQKIEERINSPRKNFRIGGTSQSIERTSMKKDSENYMSNSINVDIFVDENNHKEGLLKSPADIRDVSPNDMDVLNYELNNHSRTQAEKKVNQEVMEGCSMGGDGGVKGSRRSGGGNSSRESANQKRMSPVKFR